MSLALGIVGLPNVGKSTLFQALTKKKVDASNYPFCTIDPNVGVVTVPDERLQPLSDLSKSKQIIPTAIEFVDIAGLVKGASKGDGLGNKFLQHIREVDAIAEVVRAFENPDVIHVHGKIDPEDDKQVIQLELIFADLEQAEKRLSNLASQLKGTGTPELIAEHKLFEKIVAHLKDSKRLVSLEMNDEEKIITKPYNFLTLKPMIYIYNISENDIKNPPELPEDSVAICAKLESEFADIPEAELPEYLEQLGIKKSGLSQLIQKSYKLLNLDTYLTTGEMETRAWTIPHGATAPEAAGVIHTDLERDFIRAEVINWQELLDAGSWTAAKDLGKVRIEGKGYIVNDGDVLYIHAT